MASLKISDFFNRKFFEIPKYQRGFAWERQNVRDLFDDIQEAIESNTNHYIGTIVLSKSSEESKYFIVDGQQRITTLTMILNSIVKRIPVDDAKYFERFYIKEGNRLRLQLLNEKDREYFSNLILGVKTEPQNKSQRYLLQAYDEIEFKINQIINKASFLNAIERLEVMEFIENTEGDAIRIFQTVNDRGKPLSNMEKVKSLLIYFSNRYLAKKLDDRINEHFSEIFEIYDDIKTIGETINIILINNVNFTEDTLLRYHFVTYCNQDYDPTPNFVLQNIKNKLSELRAAGNNFVEMEEYISNYVESLKSFLLSLRNILEKAKVDPKYYKLFCIHNLSARLYPLITKLEEKKILESSLSTVQNATFFDLIELIDVRVYKTRGTDPRKHIADFVYQINHNTESEIETWLKWFNSYWMSKDLFQSNLYGNIYGNFALRGMLIDFCEHLLNKEFTIDELKSFMAKNITIEHVLSQTPDFDPTAYGFINQEDFINNEDKIGNLTLLEKTLNSAVQNMSPVNKVPYYDKSVFQMTKKIGSEIDSMRKFTKVELELRTSEIAKICLERWWC